MIGVNSAVPTPPLIASGRVGAGQLERLAKILTELGTAGNIRVVMIHHPPLPAAKASTRGLSDAAALEAVLVRHGAELLIHGHNHRDMLSWRSGPQGAFALVGAASSSMGVAHKHEPLARYNIYRIRLTAGVPAIEVITRGIEAPESGVIELRRRPLIEALGAAMPIAMP